MRDPLWGIIEHQGRSLIWLADRTGYSHSHVKHLASGRYPLTPEFRRKAALALDLPESTLFQPERSSEPVAP